MPCHYPHLFWSCLIISNLQQIEPVSVMAFAVAARFLAPTAIMSSNLLAPAQWAQLEFALAELGDQRRTQRLVKMATCLAQTPTGTLPQAFPAWKELKAAYRLLDHLEFGPAEIQQPHRQCTLAACRQPG